MKELILNYNVPIIEAGILDQDFLIQGIAINATVTGNNHKFLAEELKQSAGTLIGVPLLVDHKNEVSAIKGRVIIGEFDEPNSRINFKAKVVDNDIKKMIKEGLINSVSVGAAVKEIEEKDNVLIPRGITFKELSLVAVPADGGATFTTALLEAYKTIAEEMVKCKECGKMVPKDKMKAHLESHEEEEKQKIAPTASQSEMTSQSMKGGIKMSEGIVEAKVEPKFDMNEFFTKLNESMTKQNESVAKQIEGLKSEISQIKEAKKDKPKAEVKDTEESSDGYITVGKHKFMFEQFGGKGSLTLVR